MKKIIILFFTITLIFIGICFAENRFNNGYWGAYEHTTGGDAEALDSISDPKPNEIEFIFGTIDGVKSYSVYVFDSASTATEAGQTNIEPPGGVGRWIQMQPFFVFGTTSDLSGVSDQPGVVKMRIEE